MPVEPSIKRTVAFFDGQNLFHAAKAAFGHTYPNYSEVADEIRDIAQMQQRWIEIACAFPASPVSINRRGINGTDWIPIDRATYDACLDPRAYRAGPWIPVPAALPPHLHSHFHSRPLPSSAIRAPAIPMKRPRRSQPLAPATHEPAFRES